MVRRIYWLCVAISAVCCFGCGADSGGARRPGGSTNGFGNAAGSGSGSGSAGSGSFGNSNGGGGAAAGSGAPIGGSSCPRVDTGVERRKPRVMLVVDGSGSMEESFGMGTRWSALRAALLDMTSGLVPQLQATTEFGLTIYARADVNACPTLIEVPMAIDNFATIDGQYPQMEPGGGTPTGEALSAVVEKLPDVSNPAPDSEIIPYIIILATDGMPNGCGEPPDQSICPNVPPLIPGFPEGPDPVCVLNYFANLPPDYQGTVDATYAAQAKGISTYVVSLAPGEQEQGELQRVANVGVGMDEAANPGAPIFEPANPDALRDTLLGIIGGAVGCTLQLQGALDVARACEGEVKLNGNALGCDDANGWRAVDPGHIELTGTSCDTFMHDPSATLNAAWPCGVVVD